MKGAMKATMIVLLTAVSLGTRAVLAMAQQSRNRLSDETIKTLVERRLIKHHLQRDNNIAVSVEDGVVTLTGTVRSLAEKQQAEKDARSVDDVANVENHLSISPESLSDQQIADAVARNIRTYAFYDIFDWITGDVNNGVVTLKGWVREPWRKSDYERLATRVPGVKEVRNDIQVLPTSIFDDQLRIRIARLIYHDPVFERYAFQPYPPIHIIVENGNVILEGTVSDPVERQLAETIVRGDTLALSVTNNLKVESPREPRKDHLL
ncbi:MAG: BON domain-containing protein [Blastocatellia bacterium]|nr:BON domain-containing protein [Blastocatellia bacterium]MCS7157062.1 BON domain-containing protein [Blastocatellia bacterium]MCX7752263.1 BON domain-containing protein [Blastocatellia bacterium]MDW8167755.1 BON domain-containing protein [Acidobacteriota bacterium]MDW8256777.1 BON domain-containing protein [Acidobacteriota bacterium]